MTTMKADDTKVGYSIISSDSVELKMEVFLMKVAKQIPGVSKSAKPLAIRGFLSWMIFNYLQRCSQSQNLIGLTILTSGITPSSVA